ncbi:hypothetical protein ACIGXM_36090 [Kitasatospora sp. NPDC052896]|uniref:hypothetical protein n=1 Tax=Kitasatospora sp. NPDC052896 TaxID=3364061 RepID=UPI0037C5562E
MASYRARRSDGPIFMAWPETGTRAATPELAQAPGKEARRRQLDYAERSAVPGKQASATTFYSDPPATPLAAVAVFEMADRLLRRPDEAIASAALGPLAAEARYVSRKVSYSIRRAGHPDPPPDCDPRPPLTHVGARRRTGPVLWWCCGGELLGDAQIHEIGGLGAGGNGVVRGFAGPVAEVRRQFATPGSTASGRAFTCPSVDSANIA